MLKKNCTREVKYASKTLFKSVARGERDHTQLYEARPESFLALG